MSTVIRSIVFPLFEVYNSIMNRFLATLLIVAIIPVTVIYAAPTDDEQPSSRCGRIVGAIEKGLYDSAFCYLLKACESGLPEDSLYYYWAEIYLWRGALDTALALNLAGQRIPSNTLGDSLRRQRYQIYAALGWTKEAAALLDSLTVSIPTKPYIPRVFIDSWTGLNERNIIERQSYPFPEATLAFDRIENPAWDFTAKSIWYFTLNKAITVVPALTYNFVNRIEQSNLIPDSLNHSFGPSIEFNNLWRRLSVGYSLHRKISVYDDHSTVSALTLSRSAIGKPWLSYSSLLYLMELERDYDISHHYLSFMHFATRRLASWVDLTLLPLVSCFVTDDLHSTYRASVMYIEDPHASPVTHYTDPSCTHAIPIPSQLDIITQLQLLAAYRDAAATKTFSFRAPESYLGITPSTSLTVWLPLEFSIEGTLKTMAYYYLREHEWTSLSTPHSTKLYHDGAWLAYSRSEDAYYFVEELGNVTNAEKYSGPVDIRHFKERRIDFALGGEVGLERRLWKFGRLRVNGYLQKYWSSLARSAPVEIKELLYGFGLSFKATVGASTPPNVL